MINHEEYHKGTVFTTPRRLAWHITGDPDHPIGHDLGRQFDDLYVKLVSTETAPLYDGIRNSLLNLKSRYNDIQYGALSNACGSYVRAVLKVNDLESEFICAYGADEVPSAKPSKEGLIKICCELETEPKYCIYIGDSPTDGQAASAAEMKSIGVTWGSHSKATIQPHFDVIVDTVEDMNTEISKFLESMS